MTEGGGGGWVKIAKIQNIDYVICERLVARCVTVPRRASSNASRSDEMRYCASAKCATVPRRAAKN